MGKTFRRNDYRRPRGGKLKNRGIEKWKEYEEDKYRKHDHRFPQTNDPPELHRPIEFIEPDV